MRTRTQVLVISSVIALAFATAPATAATTPSPWFQSGFNQSRAAYNPTETHLTSSNAHTLHGVWSITTPDPCCTHPQTTGVVSVNGIAYFAGSNNDVHAVHATTGGVVWNAHTAECPSHDAGPALHLGVLLVPSQECTPDDFNSWLTAFDTSNGHVLWAHQSSIFMTSPLTVNGIAYAESDNTDAVHVRLDALDVHTGAVRWHRTMGTQTVAIAADGANLYLSSATSLQALNPTTGAVRWTRSVHGGHVLVSAGHVVVGGTSSGQTVVTSYDATGHRQWARTVGSASPFTLSATSGEVLVAAHNGLLQSLTLSGGAFGWGRVFSTAIIAQPAIAGGVVYVPLATPTSTAIFAVRDGTGATLWSFTEPSAGGDSGSVAAPAVAAGTLLASLGSGVVRAFRP